MPQSTLMVLRLPIGDVSPVGQGTRDYSWASLGTSSQVKEMLREGAVVASQDRHIGARMLPLLPRP